MVLPPTLPRFKLLYGLFVCLSLELPDLEIADAVLTVLLPCFVEVRNNRRVPSPHSEVTESVEAVLTGDFRSPIVRFALIHVQGVRYDRTVLRKDVSECVEMVVPTFIQISRIEEVEDDDIGCGDLETDFVCPRERPVLTVF